MPKRNAGGGLLPFEGNGDQPCPLHGRMDRSFLEYASYVIRDRAIPSCHDGLKPVQRRILWSLRQNDDGKFIKVANIVGHAMQYHPHGDASIGDALVVLANKRYLIERQGNFGNVYTGDPAAAPRYIECRLTPLAREELFDDELTETVPSYDGRGREPVALPSRLPLLLMLGTEGIAVGLSSRILPHNFVELLEAQIAALRRKPFELFPDFIAGGLMDPSAYDDGRGSVRIRARIEVRDGSTLAIREIPPGTTTESIIASIEDAARKGKLKVRSINDFTAERIEIEIKSPPGVEAGKLVDALYAFTSCEVSLSSRITVIREGRPAEMTVSELVRMNASDLVDLLRRQLEHQQRKLEEEIFFKTLVRIFVENRIYKSIESCRTNEAIHKAVLEGLEPHRSEYYRDLASEDVEMLLGVRIRRISLFDMEKHRQEMEKVQERLDQIRKHLRSITRYAISHLKGLISRYGEEYKRLTEVCAFEAVEARQAAFKSFKAAYDRARGYLGYKVQGEEFEIACSKLDKLLLVFRDGGYRVVQVEEKTFVGSDLLYCAHPDRDAEYTMVYRLAKATFLKRLRIGGTILNKEYRCAPEKSKILLWEEGTPETLYIRYKPAPYQRFAQQTLAPGELAVKGPKVRGKQITIKEVASVRSSPPRNWDAEAPTSRLRLA